MSQIATLDTFDLRFPAMVDYVAISGSTENRVIEYVDHLLEHFADPVRVENGRYLAPERPGSGTEMLVPSLIAHRFPGGEVGRSRNPPPATQPHGFSRPRIAASGISVATASAAAWATAWTCSGWTRSASGTCNDPGGRMDEAPATARALAAVCAEHDAVLPRAAPQFPLRHPVVRSAVVGMRSPDEVARNAAWLNTPVAPALWAVLEERGLIPAGAAGAAAAP